MGLSDNYLLSVHYIQSLGQSLQTATAAHHLSVHVEHAVYAALVGCAVGVAVYVVDAGGAVCHSVDVQRYFARFSFGRSIARQLKPAAERLQSV